MATYERETASAVEGDSRYGKLRLILLYRTLLQSSATTGQIVKQVQHLNIHK